MRILFLGDIVGRPGRRIVKEKMTHLKETYQPDLVIANGENAAHGKGITKRLYHELISYGINIITLGNHAFAKRELIDSIDELPMLVRPMNMIPEHIGISTLIVEVSNQKLAVSSIMGEVFMNNVTMSPYEAMDSILDSVQADMHFIDFHGEATAEKQTFLHRYKKDCVAILGTHTHVTTADNRVVEGCAYISDVGMCGTIDSILGRDIDEVIARTIYNQPTHYTIATGPAMLNGVVIDIDNSEAVRIERIYETD